MRWTKSNEEILAELNGDDRRKRKEHWRYVRFMLLITTVWTLLVLWKVH